MKLIKKITTAVTAMAMAAGMTSIVASANEDSCKLSLNWDVHFDMNSTPKMISDCTFTAGYPSITSFSDYCGSFSQHNDPNGKPAYVTFIASKLDSDGHFVSDCSSTFYYTNTGTNSFSNISLSTTITQGNKLRVRHTLHGNGMTCSMSGTSTI